MRQAMKIVLDKVEKFNTEVINNKEKETNPAKLKVKEFKDSVEKLENDLKQTKIMTTKLLEIYQKREEILSKKGFITREDQISIEDSVMDSIKESDPNLWKTLLQLYNNNNQN
jgi:hypothetical protein